MGLTTPRMTTTKTTSDQEDGDESTVMTMRPWFPGPKLLCNDSGSKKGTVGSLEKSAAFL